MWILRPLAGAASVGLYSVGLKYLDGLNIVPSVFTMAVFPLMSRYARAEDNSLLRAYVLSLRLLVIVSLPVAVTVTLLAQPLVWLVGGAKYLDVAETVQVLGQTFTYYGRVGPGAAGDHLEHPDWLCQQCDAVCADRGQPTALS